MRALSHPFRVKRQIPYWIGVFVVATALGVSVLALKARFSRQSGTEANYAMTGITTTAPVASETAVPMSSYKLQQLCFSRGDDIYLMDVNTGHVRKILKGNEPDISPNGELIAFVLTDHGGLQTVDVKSGAVKELAILQKVKVIAPQWSPDGSKIAFAFTKDLLRRIGILDLSTEQWQDITASYPADENYFLSSWTTRGSSVVMHDVDNVYEVDLNGKELQRIDVSKLLKQGETISSASRFSFSADKQHLLFNTAINPEQNTVIYKLNLRTSALERVTPATVDGSEPQWFPTEKEILFSQLTENKAPYVYSISKLSLEKGEAPEILVRDATNISYAPR